MKCQNCGFDNLDSEKFCLNCLQPLQKPSKNGKPRPKPFLFIIIGLFVIVLLVFLFLSGTMEPVTPSAASINQLTKQQEEALQRLSESSSVETSFYSRDGIIRYTSMQVRVANADFYDPVTVAIAFLEQHDDLLQIDDISNQLLPTKTYPLHDGTLVHFQQEYQDVPVLGSDLIVEVDSQGNALSMHGGYASNLDLYTQPVLSAEETFNIAAVDLDNPKMNSKGKLLIYDTARLDGSPGSLPRLAWIITIASDDSLAHFILDAENGEILSVTPSFVAAISETKFYDASGYTTDQLDVFNTQYPSLDEDDSDVIKVKKHLSTIDDYFDSLHRSGLAGFDISVDFFLNIENETCQVIGAGGYSFTDLENIFIPSLGKKDFIYLCNESVDSQDVIAHEFTHNVTNFFSGPNYYHKEMAEAGALSESYSDIFTAFIANYQYAKENEYNDPWLISNGNDGSLIVRQMNKNPFSLSSNTFLEYPINYRFLAEPSYPNGSVLRPKCINPDYGCSHTNSTIHSKAVYRISKEIGFYKTERIFYHTLTNGFLSLDSNFQDARISTYAACHDLVERNWFEITQSDCDTVLDAFDSVGIKEAKTCTPAPFNVVTETPKETPNIVSTDEPKIAVESDEIIIDNQSIEEKIIFISFRDQVINDGQGMPELYIMNIDGSGQARLTKNLEYESDPSVSPDGRRVLFSSHGGDFRGINVMDINGENRKHLTKNHEYSFSPAWSPDSQKIAFQTPYGQASANLHVMDADGGNQKMLVENIFQISNPSWSPNGDYIAVTIWEDQNPDIFLIDAETGSLQRVTNTPGWEWDPDWSPNGNQLAFAYSPDSLMDSFDIYVMNVDGTNRNQLTRNSFEDGNPSWSNDGKKIVFDSELDGNDEIYIMNADGNNQIRLTRNSEIDYHPSWTH